MEKSVKKIKKLSKEFQVPKAYHERVEEVLRKVQEDSVPTPRRKIYAKVVIVIAVLCLIITGYLCYSRS